MVPLEIGRLGQRVQLVQLGQLVQLVQIGERVQLVQINERGAEHGVLSDEVTSEVDQPDDPIVYQSLSDITLL